MSKNIKEPSQSEEVDLGLILNILINTFQNIYNLVGKFFNKIFLLIVWMFFFFKKNIIILLLAVVIGFIYGTYKQKTKLPIYKHITIIKQNYSTGEALYNDIRYYNELILEKDSVVLGKLLNIEPNKAASIVKFEIESIVTNNQKIKKYDNYLKTLDSVASQMNYEAFKKAAKVCNDTNQRITIKAFKKNIFRDVINTVISRVSEKDYFRSMQKKDLEMYSGLEYNIQQSLKASKDLQNVYKTVLTTNSETENSKTQPTIKIDNTNNITKTREFELYNKDNALRNELVKINRKKQNIQNVIDIISSQENHGTLDNSKHFLGLKLSSKYYYSLQSFLLIIFSLFFIKIISFLNKYKDKV